MLETVCADKALLICDGAAAGPVDYAIAVRRDSLSSRSYASGYLIADGQTLKACERCQTAAIDSVHFGRLLISLRRIEDERADFDVMESFPALDVDPPLAPELIGPEEPELLAVHSSSDADW